MMISMALRCAFCPTMTSSMSSFAAHKAKMPGPCPGISLMVLRFEVSQRGAVARDSVQSRATARPAHRDRIHDRRV